jgi:WD40 repeat protein
LAGSESGTLTSMATRGASVEIGVVQASDRSVRIGRDAVGNTIITGDHSTVVVYQIRGAVALEETEAQPVALSDNPYRGLEAFDEKDSARFFGRDREVAELWEKLHHLDVVPRASDPTGRILPIIGPSGSGKSSLARAGLVAALARRPWPGRSPSSVAVLIPGERPLEGLASALLQIRSTKIASIDEVRRLRAQLARPNEQGDFDGLRLLACSPADRSQLTVLLIDQFEEVFSTCKDKAERNAFIENLRLAAQDASGAVTIVVTLRSDFLQQVQGVDWLNAAVTRHGYIVPKMDQSALRDAITKPAAEAGFTIDRGTVDLLIEQTRGRDGALPLLQFALSRIWQGLAGTPAVAPADTLRDVGGVGGALATEAQRQYDALSAPDRVTARRAFTSGIQLAQAGPDTRRRYRVSEIVAQGQVREDVLRVLRCFSSRDARLLALSTSLQDAAIQVEITHETLISEWPTLKEWLTTNRQDILFHRRLAEAADNWKARTGSVWRNPELERLREFRRRASGELTAQEVAFHDASERQRSFEAWIARGAVLAIVAAAVTASILAFIAFRQSGQLKAELSTGRANRLAAESRAVVSRYPERSILLALEAEKLGTDNASAEQALRDALASVTGHTLGRATSSVKELALAANERWLVVKDTDGKISIKSIPEKPSQGSASHFIGYGGEYGALDISADHRWLITGRPNGLTLWDFQTTSEPGSTAIEGDSVHAFTPDSRWLAAAGAPGELRLWSLSPGLAAAPTVVRLTSSASAVTASTSTIVVSLAGGSACTINLSAVASGCRPFGSKPVRAFEQAYLTADGSVLLTAVSIKDANWRGGHQLIGWSLGSGPQKTTTLLDDVPRVERVAFSHNGQRVAVTTGTDLNTGNGGLIHLCRLDGAKSPCMSLEEHHGEVTKLLFSGDDRLLVSTGWDGTARIWRLDMPDPSTTAVALRGHSGSVNAAALDPTGRWLATAGNDQAVILWDMKARDVAAASRIYRGVEGAVSTIAFSNNSSHLFAGSGDGALHYWELKELLPSTDPDVLPVQLGHSDVETGITFSPDMHWGFTDEGEHGETLALRRVSRQRRGEAPIQITFSIKGRMLDAAFSGDSRWLAVSDANANVSRLYELSTDDPLRHERDLTGTFPGMFARSHPFSPDDHWVATISETAPKQLNLWSLTSSSAPVVKPLTGGEASILDAQYSPDSGWFLYGAGNAFHAVDLLGAHSDRVVATDVGRSSTDTWVAPDGHSLSYVSAAGLLVTVDLRGKDAARSGSAVGAIDRIFTSADRSRLLTLSDPTVADGGGLDGRLDRHIARLQVQSSALSARVWIWNKDHYDLAPSGLKVPRELKEVEFSPHARWLVTGTDADTNPALWDLSASDPFKQPTTLWGHTLGDNHLWHVAFSPDERWLATASENEAAVRLWNLRSPRIETSLAPLRGLDGSVSEVRFSPDGKLLVTRGGGGMRMWRMGDNRASDVSFSLDRLSEGSFGESFAFSPANDELVGWGGDVVRFWSLNVADLVNKAQLVAFRNFTWSEWCQSFSGQDYVKAFPNLPVDGSVITGELEQAHLQFLRGDLQKARQLFARSALWSREIGDPVMSNKVAWEGATDEMAAAVASAADDAVKMEPANGNYLDTRALVRALQGDGKGALADYDGYLAWAQTRTDEPRDHIEARKEWMAALKAGRNPFTSALLLSLHDDD